MITVKQLADAYTGDIHNQVLITEETTLERIEEIERDGGIADTLFLFLCRELCADGPDAIDEATAKRRINKAITDVMAVRKQFADANPPHLATLISTHVNFIHDLQGGADVNISLGYVRVKIERRGNTYRGYTNHDGWEGLGNVNGAVLWYMQKALSAPNIVVLEDE